MSSSYYYYDESSTYASTYTSYTSSTGSSFTYTTPFGDYPPQSGVDGSECLNYVYLVWVYFLFYIGAGYPSYYYPYIIATLLDSVPQECGGTAGENTGSSLDSSSLALLSLQQSYPFGGTGSAGVQIALSPGQSYAGYGSSGTGTNSLSAYGIQQPQVVVPQGSGYSAYGAQQGSLASFGRKRRAVEPRDKYSKVQRKKKYTSMKKIKTTKKRMGKKISSKNVKSKAIERKGERQIQNKLGRKDNRQDEKEAKLERTQSKKSKPKERNVIDLRVMERKEDRQLENIEDRKDTRQEERENDQQRNIEKRTKERKQTRSKTKKGNRQERKKKRKEKRKKERKRKSRKIENSLLGKAIPKGRVKEFKKKFISGKMKTKGFSSFKFLDNLDFPYSDSGSLRGDFRQLVKKKVINKLPDYCEEVKIEKSQKIKEDCKKRAKRIRERIIGRLGKNKQAVGASKQKKYGKSSSKQKKNTNGNLKNKQGKKKMNNSKKRTTKKKKKDISKKKKKKIFQNKKKINKKK